MKALIFLVLSTVGTFAHADFQPLATVQISEKALGGTILLIRMKHTVVINASENSALLTELSENIKKDFFKDMVMDKPVKELKERYGRENRPITNTIIAKYGAVVSNKRLKLN